MDLLRRRAGLDSRRRKDQDETDKLEGPSRLSERQEEQPEAGVSTLTAANGHINLFEGLEQVRYLILHYPYLTQHTFVWMTVYHGCSRPLYKGR